MFDFINLLAVISLSLGITNLLPIPPLDGGKILIYLIEAIRRKPLEKNIEVRNTVSWVICNDTFINICSI
ncbi:MAG: site-2 protease family protein [Clostridia bacterium]|nr:site-2 protease family protein [Clostridia bacterium]